VLDHVVELRDVMPTLLDSAGLSVPDTCQGKSMKPMLEGHDVEWRPYLHGEHCWCYSHEQAMHYLTNGEEKYVYLPYLGEEQLFNLTDDPGECVNLASKPEHAIRMEQWRERLVEELAPRNCGTVRDGKLQKLAQDITPQSPHYRVFGCSN